MSASNKEQEYLQIQENFLLLFLEPCKCYFITVNPTSKRYSVQRIKNKFVKTNSYQKRKILTPSSYRRACTSCGMKKVTLSGGYVSKTLRTYAITCGCPLKAGVRNSSALVIEHDD